MAQLVQDRHDFGLCGHVECGGRLVGQQQRRLGQQRGGDHDPLQHAARQLVRVLTQPPSPRPRCPPGRACPAARRARSAAETPRLVRSASVMKSPIRRTGFTCARGSWKIIATLVPVAAQLAARQRGDVAAVATGSRRGPARPWAAAGRLHGRSSTCRNLTRRPGRPPRLARISRLTSRSTARCCAFDRQQHGQVPLDRSSTGSAPAALIASPACACSNSRSPRTLNAMTTPTMHRPAARAGNG